MIEVKMTSRTSIESKRSILKDEGTTITKSSTLVKDMMEMIIVKNGQTYREEFKVTVCKLIVK